MNAIIQKEINKLKKHKFLHPLRLFLDVFSLLLISQWVYSSVSSFTRFGEFKVVWIDNWVFNVAPVVWFILITALNIWSITQKTKHLT